jgi:hypothetical protein
MGSEKGLTQRPILQYSRKNRTGERRAVMEFSSACGQYQGAWQDQDEKRQ